MAMLPRLTAVPSVSCCSIVLTALNEETAFSFPRVRHRVAPPWPASIHGGGPCCFGSLQPFLPLLPLLLRALHAQGVLYSFWRLDGKFRPGIYSSASPQFRPAAVQVLWPEPSFRGHFSANCLEADR